MSARQDLIVGCSTNYDWNKLKYWVNSINMSGFDGDKVLILLNCDKATVKKLVEVGINVIAFKQDEYGNFVYNFIKWPVHVIRFLHIYNLLKKKEYRYVITTDVKDVVFQKNPIEFIENNIGDRNLIFSSESIQYKNEPWGNKNLLETYGPYIHEQYKDNEIYNVGVLAGKACCMRDLAINIFIAANNRPIPICDQSTFNFMISMSPYLETCLYTKSESGWACQLGTTADPLKIDSLRPHLLEPSPKMENGKVVTSTGKEFTIVHQYDRISQWKNAIEEKFG